MAEALAQRPLAFEPALAALAEALGAELLLLAYQPGSELEPLASHPPRAQLAEWARLLAQRALSAAAPLVERSGPGHSPAFAVAARGGPRSSGPVLLAQWSRRRRPSAAARELIATSATLCGAALRGAETASRGELPADVVDRAPLLIFAAGADAAILFANAALGAAVERPSGELVGRDWRELLVPSAEQPALGLLLSSSEQPGAVAGHELPLITASGARRVVAWSLLRRPAGGAGGAGGAALIGLGEDVTGRRRAEEHSVQLQRALRRAAEEWRATFDAIGEVLIVIGASGHVERLNRAAAGLARRTPLETVGISIDELGEGEPWAAVRELFAAGVAGSLQVAAAGGHAWLVTARRAEDRDAAQGRLIVSARDVSEVVKLQASLQRSEQMATLGALVGGVAHQVRNPLFALTSLLGELRHEIGASEVLAEYLPRLGEETERLQKLMRDLLDYGRPTPPGRRRAELRPIVERACEMARGVLAERRVSVEVRSEELLPEVVVQAGRLAEALENLIRNAAQFSPEGSLIQIRLRSEEPAEDGAEIVCSVEDAGPGFPDEALDQVFEPFFTRRLGGTGLGLPLVRRIVEDHGGTLRAANRDEGGGLIELRLPAAGPEPAPE